jgi:hypothetical protein
MWALDLTTHQWTNYTQSDVPVRAGGTAVSSVDGSLFVVFAGQEGAIVKNDVQKFDTIRRAWLNVTSSGTPPPARVLVCCIFFTSFLISLLF